MFVRGGCDGCPTRFRDRPLEKLSAGVWGGGGFSSRKNCFRKQVLCMIIFKGYLACMIFYYYLIFPCTNFFLYFARPPHKFSNGPSLTTRKVRECGRQRSKVKPSGVKTLLLHSRALPKFHVIDGQTTRDQITSERS